MMQYGDNRPSRRIGLCATLRAVVFVLVTLSIASGEEAAPATRFEGVCTFALEAPDGGGAGFVLQAGDEAVWVLPPLTPPSRTDDELAVWPRVQPGDKVAVEGTLERGPHARRIFPTQIDVVGQGHVPPPVEASGSIFLDADNALRSRVRGIVQRARCDQGVWHLALLVQGHRLYVRSARPPDGTAADDLVDAEVEVIGVNGSIRNSRGQLLAPLLMINGFDDMKRVGPPPPAPFETEYVPLDEVARFGAVSLDGHRFQTEGVVTRGSPGNYVFLQSETTAVHVETADKTTFRPGDRVRVAGFLDLGHKVRGIAAAAVQLLGHQAAPQPVTASAAFIFASGQDDDDAPSAYPDYANRLVRLPATIVGRSPGRTGGALQLEQDGIIFTAQLQATAYQAARQFPAGTEISLTGIVRYDLDRPAEERADGRVSPFGKFLLLVHLPEDITLVRAAPWWTPLRLGIALAGVFGVLVAALAWVGALHRQVTRHVNTLASEIHSRREAAVEYQATLRERTRLAANLHDTLLQTMAGIGFQLEACQLAANGDDESADTDRVEDQLDVARRMIDHAVDDIRGSVWALRSAAAAGLTLEEAIEAAVARTIAGHAVAINVAVKGRPFPLPSFVTGNLMLIVQEAVFNATHHAGPTTIEVVIGYQASRMVELVVRDDGTGFVPGRQQGPMEGHFGIQGMRERVERLGGRLTLESIPGRGTTVRAVVPCREYDHVIDESADEHARLADQPIEQTSQQT